MELSPTLKALQEQIDTCEALLQAHIQAGCPRMKKGLENFQERERYFATGLQLHREVKGLMLTGGFLRLREETLRKQDNGGRPPRRNGKQPPPPSS